VIDQDSRERVRRLLSAGCTQRQAANRTGVSLRSVARIAHESTGLVGAAVGRPSTTHAFATLVRAVLARSPAASSASILRLARERGYRGCRSAMYQRVRAIRHEVASGDGRRRGERSS